MAISELRAPAAAFSADVDSDVPLSTAPASTAPTEAADPRAEALIDLAAFRANLTRLRSAAGNAALMVVVKADAYGHGDIACAREARATGVPWLGTALPAEALRLRAAGDRGRILTWLYGPGQDFAPLLRAGIDISVGSLPALRSVTAAACATGTVARVHLKVDTGLGRGGATTDQWRALMTAVRRSESVDVVGLWSHLSCADDPACDCTDRQLAAFHSAYALAVRLGLTPEFRHLANSAATLLRPETHLDLVRPGLAAYGLSPAPLHSDPAALGLRPVMTLTARLAAVKDVPPGHRVSYGHRTVTTRPTRLGLVPLGYADGVPRSAGTAARVRIAGHRLPITGRVAMDQFVVDLTDVPQVTAAGTEVRLFGPGTDGEPTAEDWARATGTIAYEIVTGIGARVPRRHLHATAAGGASATVAP